MAFRNPTPPPDRSFAWPYTLMPEQAHTEGPWKMGMSGSGSMVVWPSDKQFPESLGLIEAFRGTREQLDKFIITFCMRGYETDPQHLYQDSTVWLFNWISGTLAQVYIAGQMAKLLFDGERDAAWDLGRAFEGQLYAAHDALHNAAAGS
jgi:hypothetical protein